MDNRMLYTDPVYAEDFEPTEPEEGDLTTTDHEAFYCDGKLAFTVPAECEDYKEALTAWMDANGYYPNAWFISDHGNAHLIDLS